MFSFSRYIRFTVFFLYFKEHFASGRAPASTLTEPGQFHNDPFSQPCGAIASSYYDFPSI